MMSLLAGPGHFLAKTAFFSAMRPEAVNLSQVGPVLLLLSPSLCSPAATQNIHTHSQLRDTPNQLGAIRACLHRSTWLHALLSHSNRRKKLDLKVTASCGKAIRYRLLCDCNYSSSCKLLFMRYSNYKHFPCFRQNNHFLQPVLRR
jgi:hypothetical protein